MLVDEESIYLLVSRIKWLLLLFTWSMILHGLVNIYARNPYLLSVTSTLLLNLIVILIYLFFS